MKLPVETEIETIEIIMKKKKDYEKKKNEGKSLSYNLIKSRLREKSLNAAVSQIIYISVHIYFTKYIHCHDENARYARN